MIQPPSGPSTLKELHDCDHSESYTIGRLHCAIVNQGCNSWTILRIVTDYYNEMCAKGPSHAYWIERRDELLATEKRWYKQSRKVSE